MRLRSFRRGVIINGVRIHHHGGELRYKASYQYRDHQHIAPDQPTHQENSCERRMDTRAQHGSHSHYHKVKRDHLCMEAGIQNPGYGQP